MKEKLDKYIKDNMEKETKCYKEISLKDLLETSFYANEKGELVGEFTLTRINQIADVLTYLNEDVRTGKEIIGELEKEIERLKEKYERMKENAEILSNGYNELEKRNEKALDKLKYYKAKPYSEYDSDDVIIDLDWILQGEDKDE